MNPSRFILLDNQCIVLPAKAEAVGQYRINLGRARFIGHVIQIALRIWNAVIGRGRQNLIAQSQHACDCLHSTSSGYQMPHHALNTADRHFAGIFTKRGLDGVRLGGIIFFGAGTVGVDVINIGG